MRLLAVASVATGVGYAIVHAIYIAGGAASLARAVGLAMAGVVFGSLTVLIALLPTTDGRVLGMVAAGVSVAAMLTTALVRPAAMPARALFGDATALSLVAILLALPATRVLAAVRPAINWRRAAADGWPICALLAVLMAVTALYVEASQRILFWDPMVYWTWTDYVAEMVRQGRIGAMIAQVIASAGNEYSLIPAVLPGILIAPVPGRFLLGYMLAIAFAYVVPAILAIGALGLVLARSLATGAAPLPWRERIKLAALGGLAAILLLPHFLQVFLRFVMLDIGGVVLLVLLVIAWGRLLAIMLAPRRADEATGHARRVVAAAVAVSALSMGAFIFRRWYIFDVLGFAAAAAAWLAVEVLRQRPCWRPLLADLGVALATALVTAIALGPTVLGQWVVRWGQRNYAESYAAYWRDWHTVLLAAGQCFGYFVPALCCALALALIVCGRSTGLPPILLGGTALAVVGFHQVQGPSVQHFYLVMPLLGGMAAAGAILAAQWVGALPVLAGLLAVGWFLGLAPRLDDDQHHEPVWPGSERPEQNDSVLGAVQPVGIYLWPQRDANAPELARLGHWLDENVGAEAHYCIAASGVSVNTSVLANLWQVDPSLRGGAGASRAVELQQVDTRDGPPDARLRQCQVMIVATPPQTHIRPSDQQSILLLRDAMLDGLGPGRAYTKLDTVFSLPSGITLSVYRQTSPITDDELRAVRRQFYATKGNEAAHYEQRFGAP
jgi:hypothetical protein